MNKLSSTIALAAFVAMAPVAGAQSRAHSHNVQQAGSPAVGAPDAKELGLDGGLGFVSQSGQPTTTLLGLPVQNVRFGFYTSPQLEWEPFGSLNYAHQDQASNTYLGLGLGVLYHLQPSRMQNQFYVRPFLDLNHSSYSTSNQGATTTTSTTQWGLGAGFGIKVPMMDRIGSRFELNFEHRFKDGQVANAFNQFGLLAGLSYYTR